MPDPAEQAKRTLRTRLREARRARTGPARDAAAAGLRTQLEALLTTTGARSVSCYLATADEPGTAPFVAAALERGVRVLLPISRDDGLLDWAEVVPEGELVAGRFGLSEPVGARLGPAAVADVDLMIVPAAAVDRTGMRLGWGRGYYDRTLASLPATPPVYAVVFDDELLDRVPTEPHDQPVTGVVTPTQTIPLAVPAR